ncbi:tagaturonate epimerase family protein [Aeoliella mucimassa]|uniref:Tagaturonate/fructuronate epimerase n=1 Tax=Aeoliella mucimassa TaxID=2527972 RepID=A0A518AME1_9BACT|nr:tagaturonate epimerase family protein [Aeoliella mucimassa]QDU55892.1 hypothetical protein Pan181_20890 [Aeoliella mucimassa]
MSDKLVPQPLGIEPSFGFGDRLGSATAGHLTALNEAGGPIRGIFAQQSIREMTRTNRTAEQVMQCAVEALQSDSYALPWGADADHLKTPEDVQRTMAAGFVFFTLDPSGDVDQQADSYDEATLQGKFATAREWAPWYDAYLGQTIHLDSGPLEFEANTLQRAAVKYGKAILSAIKLAKFVESEALRLGRPFELELSVDETDQPTTAAEHYLIADQFRQAGVKLVSLAPRFIGDFEKGVDFKGELAALEESLAVHAEIAERMGPYKLSLHSGSDKLTMYPALARATQGRFHVKTAGTSYLEALRVAAHKDPAFFREVVDFSRNHFDEDKATYHVSAEVATLPPSAELDDTKLEQVYLERWCDVPAGRGFVEPGRQVLHCTFGSVVTDSKLGPQLTALLTEHADVYTEILREHFVRHLHALR